MEPWNQFLQRLDLTFGKETIDRWLRSLQLIRFDAANLYLEADHSFQIDWFEEHIRPILKKGFYNNNQRTIKVHLTLKQLSFEVKRVSQSNDQENIPLIGSDPLDPEMTLSHFITSENNRISLKTIEEIEKNPFNPIVLYGPKRSGKTHLLMSAAHKLQEMGKTVFFVKAESFTEHVVQALRLGWMDTFRKRYRQIDALIVDDIHLFARKHATQEEFFHTFNTLHTNEKTIILSANKAPSHLEEIEPRLISRFEWGLTLPLETIDDKTLLMKKSALWKIPISSEVIEFLTHHFPSSPLMALQALAIRAKSPNITVELAAHLLKDLLEEEKKKSYTPEKIIKKVAAHYGITVEDLLSKAQTKEMTTPRQVAMYFCRHHLHLPYQAIGKIFNRDHSTVMFSIKQIEKAPILIDIE